MQKAVGLFLVLFLAVFAGCLGGGGDDLETFPGAKPGWMDDAVVIAVIDFGFNPYHVEWDAAQHPANRDGDPATDFAFDRPPHEYLSGFPQPDAFGHYGALETSRATDLDQLSWKLAREDKDKWDEFQGSSVDNVSYYWLPDTKVIGLVSFSSSSAPAPVANSTAHGSRVASVTAGSFYGSCPECLLVFIQHGPGALEWANSQSWIDVVTNSYGSSGAVACAADECVYPSVDSNVWARTHIYAGDDGRLAQEATERGQTTVFSAGNGLRNSYNIPTTPFTSSQRGPDWILRVGAIYHDTQNAPMGVGKPVDVASLGTAYPSQGHPLVTSSGTMSGTSNAAPVTAGMLARVLFEARLAMEGPSRTQEDGIVAVGAFECAQANPDCALGGGVLTRADLVERFLHSAVPVVEEWQPRMTNVCTPSPLPGVCEWLGVPVVHEEMSLMVEGHGVFFGRFHGTAHWWEEITRVMDQLSGAEAHEPRRDGEAEWFQVISYCNQMFWGQWENGHWVPGDQLPGPDPSWPTRTALAEGCEEAAMAFHAYLDAANAG
jgi:hypothetical protein